MTASRIPQPSYAAPARALAGIVEEVQLTEAKLRGVNYNTSVPAPVRAERERVLKEKLTKLQERRNRIQGQLTSVEVSLRSSTQSLLSTDRKELLARRRELHEQLTGALPNPFSTQRTLAPAAATLPYRSQVDYPGSPIMVHITYTAYLDAKRFFDSHPEIYEGEKKESGVDPLADPDAYFSKELAEPAHKDVRLMVELHNGILGRGGVARWIPEEDREQAQRLAPRPEYPGGHSRHETSVCPRCGRYKELTGQFPYPICRFCEPVHATMRAPRGDYYPGSPFYPGAVAQGTFYPFVYAEQKWQAMSPQQRADLLLSLGFTREELGNAPTRSFGALGPDEVDVLEAWAMRQHGAGKAGAAHTVPSEFVKLLRAAKRGVEIRTVVNGQGRGDGYDATAYEVPYEYRAYPPGGAHYLIVYHEVTGRHEDRYRWADTPEDVRGDLLRSVTSDTFGASDLSE
ncbi:MAG: hypothetical protein ACREB9_04810 [Thermoplasmata archaeon]